ncbi:MAG: 3-deoxy-manno-octulosonate cytidylyltransferase [Bacteroidota bacterium]
MRFICIIPARYSSTRFPGKPLAEIGGKRMIERVYQQATASFHEVWVATDDIRIERAVSEFGGKAVITSLDHKSGTDRCAEAIIKIEASMQEEYDVVVNIQGDEPFIHPSQLGELKKCFDLEDTQIASLIKPIHVNEDIFNPNLPKVIFNQSLQAIYFSRSPIPFVRDHKMERWHNHHQFYRHIGLYAYRKNVLLELTKLQPSNLEKAESLEQNRWIENGFRIQLGITQQESIGIDTPEDLLRANEWLKHMEP